MLENPGTSWKIQEDFRICKREIDSYQNSMEYMHTTLGNWYELIISLDMDKTNLEVWHLSRSRRDKHIQSMVKSPNKVDLWIGRTTKLWINCSYKLIIFDPSPNKNSVNGGYQVDPSGVFRLPLGSHRPRWGKLTKGTQSDHHWSVMAQKLSGQLGFAQGASQQMGMGQN